MLLFHNIFLLRFVSRGEYERLLAVEQRIQFLKINILYSLVKEPLWSSLRIRITFWSTMKHQQKKLYQMTCLGKQPKYLQIVSKPKQSQKKKMYNCLLHHACWYETPN